MQKEWIPYLASLPMEYQRIIKRTTGHVKLAAEDDDVPINAKSSINEQRARYTGKLRTCDACGKLETKRGSLSKCSKCKQVMYCSKEVSLFFLATPVLLIFVATFHFSLTREFTVSN